MEKNIEIESKIIEVNHESLEHRILELGGKKEFDLILEAFWYENINGSKVRVRKEGDKTVVEYKEKIDTEGKSKKSKEIGYIASDFDNQLAVFEQLGLKQISRSIKRRVSYLLTIDESDVKLEFDKYSDLDGMEIPELLEIEACSEDIIIKVSKLLGYNEGDLKDWGVQELVEYYSLK